MSEIPMWAHAGFWGLVAGSALLLGAAAGYWLNHRLVYTAPPSTEAPARGRTG